MKIGELASFGHNIADSLASGVCFMVNGGYSNDLFGEASASPEGHIIVDFMTGSTSGSPISANLERTIQRYAKLLPDLAERHGLDLAGIKVLSARFGTDSVFGPHFSVTVEALDGRRSIDRYVGIPGKRFGRPRRNRSAT
jgi:hypothetical protein